MPSIFEKYDLKQVINTSGRMTILGVSTPRPEVVEAAMAGMNQYFEMKDLVNKTGAYIAKLLDVEGATVVSCASLSMLFCTQWWDLIYRMAAVRGVIAAASCPAEHSLA